jgi:uncharacterized protein (TIGR04255 family)
MASPGEHIVDYTDPPVAEVGLAVQLEGQPFDAPAALNTFWPLIRDKYPHLEPQPPLPPMEERFEIPAQPTVAFVLGGPDMQRWLFVSEDEREVLQVQQNRLGYNWRKESSEARYPRYDYVRKRFEEAMAAYRRTAQHHEREVGVAWCEVTYANPVIEEPGAMRPDLSTLLTRVAPQELSMLPSPFNMGLRESFQLARESGEPFARFYVEVESTVHQPDRRLGYTITLTMRGRPATPDLAGALEFFDMGRATIVTTFSEVTTPERQEAWGRQR